jgi:hypothetical protein
MILKLVGMKFPKAQRKLKKKCMTQPSNFPAEINAPRNKKTRSVWRFVSSMNGSQKQRSAPIDDLVVFQERHGKVAHGAIFVIDRFGRILHDIDAPHPVGRIETAAVKRNA